MKNDELEKDFQHVVDMVKYEGELDKQLEVLNLLLQGVQILKSVTGGGFGEE